MPKQVDENDVAVVAKTRRIAAFDIIRGFFLIVILIDHIELYPSFFDLFTGRGRLFVSAAEGFFFMSGLLVGMVYRRKLSQGMRFIFKKMWSRAIQLYLASVMLTLLFTYWAVAAGHTEIKEGLPAVINWGYIIKETFLMRYGFGWADFLDRFAILMFMAPLVFWLIAKRLWWLMLVISFGMWWFRGNGFTWSWQLLFNSAMLIGYYYDEIRAKLNSFKPQTKTIIRRSIFTVSAITFTFSYAVVFLLSFLNQHYDSLTPWLRHLTFTWNNYNADIWVYAQKWTLGPLRLVLFFFWFATLFYLVQKYQSNITSRTYGVIELLGRNSLFVYIAHAFIVFGFQLFIPYQTNILQNFVITAAALLVLIIVTVFYRPICSDWAENHSLRWSSLIAKSKAQLAI